MVNGVELTKKQLAAAAAQKKAAKMAIIAAEEPLLLWLIENDFVPKGRNHFTAAEIKCAYKTYSAEISRISQITLRSADQTQTKLTTLFLDHKLHEKLEPQHRNPR